MTILFWTAGATFAAFTLLWAVSLRLRDAGIVDMYWGPGFAVIGWIAFAFAGRFDAAALVLLGCVTIWGARLGWHMISRHAGVEDARYAAMRVRHGSAFAGRSLWMVFWLQAAIQWLASSPALAAALASGRPSVWIVGAGAVVFALGFALEVAADRGIRRFRSDPSNRGKLLTDGVHGFVRHPNYLGEIILQWGLGLIAFGVSGHPLAFAGPAVMHVLIVKVSGVPLLEEQFRIRPGYAEWASRTGALWPRFRS
ncbi:MAG: DUF1295 domain-containing protein [Beijerinckiaceae bacterium]